MRKPTIYEALATKLNREPSYEKYLEWCRKWIVPPEVISYEDF